MGAWEGEQVTSGCICAGLSFSVGFFFIRSRLGDDSKRQKAYWCVLSWMREQMLPVPYWALINPSAVLQDCHKVLKKELLLLWPSCGSSCTHLQTHHRSRRRWEQQALCRRTDTGQVRRHVRLLLCVWWFVYYICFGAPFFLLFAKAKLFQSRWLERQF